jgi:hypothetical protein
MWKYNIKVYHKEIRYEDVTQIVLPQDVMKWQWCSEYGGDPSCPIKGREFVNQLKGLSPAQEGV